MTATSKSVPRAAPRANLSAAFVLLPEFTLSTSQASSTRSASPRMKWIAAGVRLRASADSACRRLTPPAFVVQR